MRLERFVLGSDSRQFVCHEESREFKVMIVEMSYEKCSSAGRTMRGLELDRDSRNIVVDEEGREFND